MKMMMMTDDDDDDDRSSKHCYTEIKVKVQVSGFI